MKKKILVPIVALAIIVAAGVNHKMINESIEKVKCPLKNLFAIVNVQAEVSSGSTMTISCKDAVMKTCQGSCSRCGKSASTKGKSPVSVTCNCQ